MNKKKILNLALAGTLSLSSLFGFASASSAASFGQDIADRAEMYIGNKITDHDSADFISNVFKKEGLSVPGNLSDLSNKGQLILDPSKLKEGDVVFFGTSRANLIAAGIYTGNGEFVVSYKPYKTVRQLNAKDEVAKKYFLGAKRITPADKAPTIPKETGSYATFGKKLIKTGEKYLGVKYGYGKEYETSGRFDCSSFTQYVYKKNGIKISRGARAQYQDGKKISRKDLKVGDLVFFSTTATVKYSKNSIKRIGHVGIYAGNNKVLHTYGKGGVKYSDMSKGWWDKHYVGAARIVK